MSLPPLPAVIALLFLSLLLPSPSALFVSLLLPSPSALFVQPECSKKAKSPPPSNRSSSHGGGGFSPSPAFTSDLQTTIALIQKLVQTVSSFTGVSDGDLRLSCAVSDCLDLLDLSASELSLSLNPSRLGSGDRRSDLLSWLSAALGNQDTCSESLSSTSSILASILAPGLDSVTGHVSKSLSQVAAPPSAGRKLIGRWPEWVSPVDRKLLQGPGGMAADAVVASDGSGQYKTVTEAVDKAPEGIEKRFVIYVKKGVYKENVEIKKKKYNIMLVGDGMDQTVISGSRNFVDGYTTYRSATVGVSGRGFFARDLTIENTAGPSKHQAVALRSDSDLSVYYRCAFRGYQDTLYAHSLRQFYRECVITGTVDYIFGDAAAVIQNSLILSRLPLPSQKNTVTAQGRKDPNQNTGFSIQYCNITADSDLAGEVSRTYTYLGRPWKEYSRTVVMQSYLGAAIRPEGWLPWNGDFALATLYYAEYMNFGPGSGLASRVKWQGYHSLNSSADAAKFTVARFIDGDVWLPSTGVKYTAGLTV